MILCLCPNPSVDTFVEVADFAPGQVNRALEERRFPGGKGTHVALAVRELGGEATLLGLWGGPTGEWIVQRCEALGVLCSGPRTEKWSRLCLSFKSDGAWDETELLGVGPDMEKKEWEAFEGVFKQSIGKANVVSLSGSWPRGAAPEAGPLLLRRAKEAGTPCYLDASGEALRRGLEIRPFGLHVNLAEARQLLGSELSAMECARLLAKRATRAAVTAGAEGLCLAEGDALIHAVCPVESVASAVGSGDCLLAGLCLAHERGASLEEAARLGAACGAANCLRPDLGMLRQADVQELLPRTIVRRTS